MLPSLHTLTQCVQCSDWPGRVIAVLFLAGFSLKFHGTWLMSRLAGAPSASPPSPAERPLMCSADSSASKRMRRSLKSHCRMCPSASAASWVSPWLLPNKTTTPGGPASSVSVAGARMLEQTASFTASALSATMCTSLACKRAQRRLVSRGALDRMASRMSSMICMGGSPRGWSDVSTMRSQNSDSAQPHFARSPRRSSPLHPSTAVRLGLLAASCEPNESHVRTTSKACFTSCGVAAS
mmetsp:Transcript_59898/g.165770  ORF Transcript_59898/g.165770 Transcript_59898/m.165770 type:complete len:239 (+) Transcript_59898:94-810(+)